MKHLLFTLILSLSWSAHAFGAQDIVMKMIRAGDVYQVSFGNMAQIYHIKASDKNVECLTRSIEEKKFVKVEVDSKKAKILSCQ